MRDYSNLILTHATISDNSASYGGGGISSYQSDTIILQDVIVSGHFVEGGTGFDHAGGGIKSTDTIGGKSIGSLIINGKLIAVTIIKAA